MLGALYKIASNTISNASYLVNQIIKWAAEFKLVLLICSSNLPILCINMGGDDNFISQDSSSDKILLGEGGECNRWVGIL